MYFLGFGFRLGCILLFLGSGLNYFFRGSGFSARVDFFGKQALLPYIWEICSISLPRGSLTFPLEFPLADSLSEYADNSMVIFSFKTNSL